MIFSFLITFPYILNCNLLQEAVCEDLGVPALPAKVSASAVPGTNMFTLTAEGRDPQTTYDVLISALENYPSVAKYVVGHITFEILKQPVVATSPSNSVNYFSEATKGAIVGVVLGLLFIFFYILQRKTVKTKTDKKAPVKQELGTHEPQENGAEPAKKNHRRRRRRRPKKQNDGQSAANSVVPEDKNEIV